MDSHLSAFANSAVLLKELCTIKSILLCPFAAVCTQGIQYYRIVVQFHHGFGRSVFTFAKLGATHAGISRQKGIQLHRSISASTYRAEMHITNEHVSQYHREPTTGAASDVDGEPSSVGWSWAKLDDPSRSCWRGCNLAGAGSVFFAVECYRHVVPRLSRPA